MYVQPMLYMQHVLHVKHMQHIQQCTTDQQSIPKRKPTHEVQHVLAMAGWEIDFLDVDLTAAKPTATLRCTRADGRWIYARIDEYGRCSLDRFHRDRQLGMSYDTNGRRPLSPQIEDRFLGRTTTQGPRSLLRVALNYISDNAMQPISTISLRAAFSPHLQSRLTIVPDIKPS